MKKKQIPNCSICKWLYHIRFPVSICGACGFDYAANCWNTRKCKKLFEMKDNKMEGDGK